MFCCAESTKTDAHTRGLWCPSVGEHQGGVGMALMLEEREGGVSDILVDGLAPWSPLRRCGGTMFTFFTGSKVRALLVPQF